MSESFPDEGDKVEVISRALMQYDSSRTAGTQLRAAERRRRRNPSSTEGSCEMSTSNTLVESRFFFKFKKFGKRMVDSSRSVADNPKSTHKKKVFKRNKIKKKSNLLADFFFFVCQIGKLHLLLHITWNKTEG